MHERLLTYGLKDGVLIHISSAANGKRCDCFCANCQHPLIAKNNANNKKVPHFAHASGKECEGAYESTLHLLAKEILRKRKKLRLPNFHHDYNNLNTESLFREGQAVNFDEIRLEERINYGGGFIVPDAIGKMGDREVYIEFAVTHFVEEEKGEALKKLNVACFEIDLSETELDKEAIIALLDGISVNKSWVCNPH